MAFNEWQTKFGNALPTDLGTASPGVSDKVSREDHVHQMPTAAQVGASNPNILINADFRNPVNTRSASEYSGAEGTRGTIDGWVTTTSLSLIQVMDGFISSVRTVTVPDNAPGHRQLIESADVLDGKIVTFSIIYRTVTTVPNAFFLLRGLGFNDYIHPSQEWRIATFTTTARANPPHIEVVQFQASSTVGDRIDIIGAKLELGNASTLANDPPAQFNNQFLLSTGASPTQSNPNILHNWDFRNPVNQRGGAVYSRSLANIYTIDRWRITGPGVATNLHTVTVEGDAILVTNNHSSQLMQFRHPIEFPSRYRDSTFTLSIDVASVTGEGVTVATVSGSHAIQVGASGILSYRITTATIGIPEITFTLPPNSSLRLIRIKLEPGETSTLANDPPMDFGWELAVCQRFQLLISPPWSWNMYAFDRITAGDIAVSVPIPTSLRITPTLSGSHNEPLNIMVTDEFNVTHTGFTHSIVRFDNAIRVTMVKPNHGISRGTLIFNGAMFDANL